MTKKDNSGKEFFIPYILEDDGAFDTLNITRSDVSVYYFGKKRVLVYMVPNYDPQVYKDVMHLICADLSKKARESRCKISNGNGGLITCKGNCNKCERKREGFPLSIEHEQEQNGFEVADESPDAFEIATLKMTLEDLFLKLRSQNPRYADILEGLYKGLTHHEIGLKLGRAESTIQEQISLALVLARTILDAAE